MSGSVWLITGAQASGKSTTADLLARQFERGVHVRGGQFCRWAVRGWVHWDDQERPAEGRRLLDLRYRLSAMVADEYAAAGFACVVQDNIYGEDVDRWLSALTCPQRHLVVLRPAVEVLADREAERQRATGKVAYRGSYTPQQNDADLSATSAGLGLWLDTTHLAPDQVVAEILRRDQEALVA